MSEKRISFHGHAPGKAAFQAPQSGETHTVFLLSPANLAGVRGKRLLQASSCFELSLRLQSSQATLGEVFSFVSGLYFRGKLAYASQFARPPLGISGVRIITSSSGLLTPEYPASLEWLRATTESSIDPDNPRYRDPLIRDAQLICGSLPQGARVILLGSVATPKYVAPLLEVFGPRLFYPLDFAGRGDMSRGSLLLRCTRENRELSYGILGPVRT
ncbi:MAG TPA: hypothetical protein VGF61_01830 [Candidatus Acidoferrum sp.]|jgi:hypothetical protein